VFSRALRKLKPIVAQVLGRSRFAEDALASAMGRGIDQYVIVGAGLDSYALRRPDSAAQLRIFEVDHPDTQRAKRRRLGSLDIALPANLEFVAIDFERQELSEAMKGSSYRRDRPAFYSWLGTTHYLTPQTTLATLGSITRCGAPGSEVVVDYSVPLRLIDPDKLRDLLWVEKLAGRMGEPLIGMLDPDQLHTDVAQLGYEIVEDLAAPEQARRYFSNRTDGLEPTPVSRLLHLRLP
jgi:methyltransferase (TIGR00027 family)